jgi:hypothetical protein
MPVRKADNNLKLIAVTCAMFLLALAAFAYGFAVNRFGLWPNQELKQMEVVARSLLKHGRVLPDGLIKPAPEDAPRERVVVHAPERLNGGFYGILGWDDAEQRYSAWLYDARGQLRHTWPIDYAALDPDGPSDGSDAPHGFKLLPDGSLLINFDKGDALARLDTCGEALWTKQGHFHHSIERADDGSFWTWRGEGSAYSQYQYLVNFDPADGAVIREIGLVEDIIQQMDDAAPVFGVRSDREFLRYVDMQDDESDDIFHPNDIEPLSSTLADRFPDFAPGDLLISLRNLNLVAVVDPTSGQTKWWSTGPWRYQHDPDFTTDGRISVYNNNSDRGRSEITLIDPASREVSHAFADGDFHFYSHSMGKHQYLPNGNALIVVPGEGRVVEVSPDGQKVFEFNNTLVAAGSDNGHVENAVWVAADFFESTPGCAR